MPAPLSRRDARVCSRIVAVAAGVTLALAGCAAPASEATSAPEALPAKVTAEFAQLRSDVAARQAQVRFRNDGEQSLVLGALEVHDDRFAGPATRVLARESVVPPGAAVDVRVQLPPMECRTDSGESTIVVTYTGGSETATVESPVTEPIPFLADLHARECLAEALSSAAALSFRDFTPSPPGEPGDLVLEITPTGAAVAAITGIRATNLLAFGRAMADDTYVVHVPLVPLRCDAHAVQEDKRGTIFTLGVVVEGEPGEIELAASPEQRGQVLAWVGEWCGFGV